MSDRREKLGKIISLIEDVIGTYDNTISVGMGAGQTKSTAAAGDGAIADNRRPQASTKAIADDNAENVEVGLSVPGAINSGSRSPLEPFNKTFSNRKAHNQQQAVKSEDSVPPTPPKRAKPSGPSTTRRSHPTASTKSKREQGEREMAKFLREMAEVERFVLVIEEQGRKSTEGLTGTGEREAAAAVSTSRRHSAPEAHIMKPTEAADDTMASTVKKAAGDNHCQPSAAEESTKPKAEKAVTFATAGSGRKRHLVLADNPRADFNVDLDIDVTDDEDNNIEDQESEAEDNPASTSMSGVGCAPLRGGWKATVKRLKRPFARLSRFRQTAATIEDPDDPVADSGPVVLTSRRPRRSTAIFRLSRKPQKAPQPIAKPQPEVQQSQKRRRQPKPPASEEAPAPDGDIDSVLAGLPEFATDSFRVLTGRMLPPPPPQPLPQPSESFESLAAVPEQQPALPQPPMPQSIQVTSSGLDPNQIAQLRQLCELHSDKCAYQARFQFNPDCHTTHVVIRESSVARVGERTLKYFQALVSGAWLLSFDWVSESLASGSLQPESNYEIQGDLSCGVNHMGPARSRRGRARCPGPSRLLEQFSIAPVGEFINMPTFALQTLVQQCGGQFVAEPELLPRRQPAGRLSVAVADQDDARFSEPRCRHLAASGDIVVLNRDWLLDSISKFRVQQLDSAEYCIAPDCSVVERLVLAQLGSLSAD